MPTTIRTFPSADAAREFYATTNPYNRNEVYNSINWNALYPSGSAAPAGSSAGNLTGSGGVTDYSPAYGGKPLVPNPVDTAAKATTGNLANLASIEDLARQVNEFNLGQVTNQYTAGIPNYTALAAQSSRNIEDALRGDPDYAALQRAAAQYGIGSGTTGSAFTDVNLLNQTLKEKQARQAYGEQALTNAVARMPKTSLYDVSKQFVSPEDLQAAEAAANLYAAAPVPSAANTNALGAALAGMAGAGRTPARSRGTGGGFYIEPQALPTVNPSRTPYVPETPKQTYDPNLPSWGDASPNTPVVDFTGSFAPILDTTSSLPPYYPDVIGDPLQPQVYDLEGPYYGFNQGDYLDYSAVPMPSDNYWNDYDLPAAGVPDPLYAWEGPY